MRETTLTATGNKQVAGDSGSPETKGKTMSSIKCILDIPAEEYHADAKAGEFLSSHLLGDFRACPKLYRKKMLGEIEQPETAAYLLGRAAHKLILEGRSAFDEEFEVSDGPVNPKTGEPFGRLTKAYAGWLAVNDKPVISGKDFGFLVKLQTAVWLHAEAGDLLSDGVAEGTVRTEYCGEPCQIRMDYFNPGAGIVDLKTCDDLTWFERDVKRYGYAYQLAFYRAVLREASGENASVYIVGVEKREPFRVGVWRIESDVLDAAEKVNEAAIKRLHACRATNEWPTLFEGVRTINEL